METVNQWKDIIYNTFRDMGTKMAEVLPNLIGAILVLLLGWIITKITIYILKRVFKLAKVDNLTDKLKESEVFGKVQVNFKISNVILGFIKFIMFLVFLTVSFEILNWKIVSEEIGNLLRYIPKLFSAIALFMVGLYIANFIKKAIAGFFSSFDLVGAKAISHLIYYLIAIIITITALNQAGIDTTIITNNRTLVLGSFLLAFAIAFGFGSKDVIQSLLFSFYSKRNFEIGQHIKVDDIKGQIESIDNICITLKTVKGKVVIPIKELVDKKVEIED